MRTLRSGIAATAAVVVVLGLFTSGAVVAGVAEPVEMKYTWEKGKTHTYRITQETNADMSGMPGQGDMKMSQSQTMRVRMEVLDVNVDGKASVRTTLDAVKFEMAPPTGERVRYDSEAAEGGAEDEAGEGEGEAGQPEHPAARAMAAFVGESFTFDVTPTGEVSNVQGMDKILEKIAAESGDPAMQETFKGKFGNEAMESMLEQGFKLLPDEPVEPGDSWETNTAQEVPSLGTMKMTSSMTLDRVEPTDGKRIARIPISVTTVLDRTGAGEEGMLPPGTTITMEESKGEGVLMFDLDLGQMRRMEMTSRMPLRMTMTMGEEEMTIKQDITSVVRVERLENGDAPATAQPAERPAAEPAPVPGGGGGGGGDEPGEE